MTSPLSANTSGLSVAEPDSTRSTFSQCDSAPRTAPCTHGMHRLRAIEQGQPLFCFETLRLKSSAGQRFMAFHSFALKKCLAFTNQSQSEMSERSEIAAGADRSFLWNNGADTAIEHLTKHLDDFEPDTAEAERKHVGAQQHHGAHLGLRKRIANSAGMTANEVKLQLSQSVARDANVREFTKARADTINGRVARDDFFNDFSRGKNTGPSRRGDLNNLMLDRHGCDLDERKLLAVQFHRHSLIGTQRNGKGRVGALRRPDTAARRP